MKKTKDQLPNKPLLPAPGIFGISPTDPQGSYTGIPVVPDEIPIQDADDL